MSDTDTLNRAEKLASYFSKPHHFKQQITELRKVMLKHPLVETFKWSFPSYTFNKKNVLAICKFKNHYSIWFYTGVFLKDESKVLVNAQEGKTKAMRHWKFTSDDQIDPKRLSQYIE